MTAPSAARIRRKCAKATVMLAPVGTAMRSARAAARSAASWSPRIPAMIEGRSRRSARSGRFARGGAIWRSPEHRAEGGRVKSSWWTRPRLVRSFGELAGLTLRDFGLVRGAVCAPVTDGRDVHQIVGADELAAQKHREGGCTTGQCAGARPAFGCLSGPPVVAEYRGRPVVDRARGWIAALRYR